jgi:large subunit ribosomal protein L29
MATRKKKDTAAAAKVSKAAALRDKDVAALQTEIKDLQKAHFGLRMQKATLRVTRRDIARAKTILAQKQQESAK